MDTISLIMLAFFAAGVAGDMRSVRELVYPVVLLSLALLAAAMIDRSHDMSTTVEAYFYVFWFVAPAAVATCIGIGGGKAIESRG